MSTMDPKGEGRGRGQWTAKGRQAAQQGDIDALKALVEEMGARLDALEAGDTTGGDTGGGTGTGGGTV